MFKAPFHVQLVDPACQCLRHLRDEPKPVTAEYCAGTQWVAFGSTVIAEPMPGGSGSTYENAWIRFDWTGGFETNDIRFRFDGDTCYEPAEHGGTMTVRKATGTLIMVR